MDFLDIIGKVIEFSEKGEEYSDEIKAFKATLESLQLTVKHVEPKDMPPLLRETLNDNLKEAKDLLNKVATSSGSWFTNLKNMLPGSHLQKIKEKNQQLVHVITLINLHLSTTNSKRSLETVTTSAFDDVEPAKLKKMHTMQDSTRAPSLNMNSRSASDTLYGPTLDTNADEDVPDISGPTQYTGDDDGMDDGECAFKLRVIYDQRLGTALKKAKDFEAIIEKRWEGQNSVEYVCQRLSYAYLPMEDCGKISRDHAIISAIKKVTSNGKKKEDLIVQATVPDEGNGEYYGATIADTGDDGVENGAENGGSEENEFILKDLSLNGTYYMKRSDLLNFPAGGMKIKGDFKLLKKNEEAKIENGDIIGLIMLKPQCQELIFGFQLLTE